MRLWIDGQCLQTASRLRGIGRYVQELIRAIHRFSPEVELSISFNAAMPDEAINARALVAPWVASEHVHVWQGIAEGGEATHGNTAHRRLSEMALGHHVECLAPDVALAASPFEGVGDFAVPYVKPHGSTIRTAFVFFDVIPYRYPERYLTSPAMAAYYKRRLAEHGRADLLLAISRFSQDEASSLFPTVRVAAIDAGVSPDFLALAQRATDPLLPLSLGVRQPYLLYVGALDWRKNVTRVVEAFTLLPAETRKTLQFVIVGDFPLVLEIQIKDQWRSVGLSETNLMVLGHVSDASLVQLYKQASCVIQPSLMEGFGLTALEAMCCGAPVIAADAGALPEVVGDAAALFKPTVASDIADHIDRVITDSAFCTELVGRSAEQSGKYSWERTARLAVAALASLIKATPATRSGGSTDAESLAPIRLATFARLGDLDLDPVLIARTLAAAEIVPRQHERLLVDVTSTCRVDHATGIQRVVNRISRGLEATHPEEASVTLTYCDSLDGFTSARRNATGALRAPDRDDSSRIRFARNDRILMLDSSWEFFPVHDQVLRKARLQGGQVISTIYDLVPLRMPAFCVPVMPTVYAHWFRTALRHSDGLVCISRAVADEVLSWLRAIRFPRPLRVGYWSLGADFGEATDDVDEPDAEEPVTRSPTALMVGTIEPRKGYGVALDAFEQLWHRGIECSLWFAGKRGWGVEALFERLQSHREYGKRLRWFDSPDDVTLQGLYRRCDVLLAASYAEGFGLPIVEAAHHHKPIIASDIPVFREVAQDSGAALFFDVGSPKSLAAAVEEFVARQSDFESKAMKTGRSISWIDSAKQLEEVVLGDRWYQTYEPPSNTMSTGQSGLGQIAMLAPLEEGERRFGMELISGPTPLADGASYHVVVKVTNESSMVWSSAGNIDGTLAINLSYRARDASGNVVRSDNQRTPIPFVLIPHDSLYMAVVIDLAVQLSGAAYVDIEMVQEGVEWWGDPLRVELDQED